MCQFHPDTEYRNCFFFNRYDNKQVHYGEYA